MNVVLGESPFISIDAISARKDMEPWNQKFEEKMDIKLELWSSGVPLKNIVFIPHLPFLNKIRGIVYFSPAAHLLRANKWTK